MQGGRHKQSHEGLNLQPALNAVEAGLYQVWQLLSLGKLKVFRTCGNWLQEYRLYQRDKEGKVVKQNDHLMDATRYLIVSGLQRMRVQPGKQPTPTPMYWGEKDASLRWMT